MSTFDYTYRESGTSLVPTSVWLSGQALGEGTAARSAAAWASESGRKSEPWSVQGREDASEVASVHSSGKMSVVQTVQASALASGEMSAYTKGLAWALGLVAATALATAAVTVLKWVLAAAAV